MRLILKPLSLLLLLSSYFGISSQHGRLYIKQVPVCQPVSEISPPGCPMMKYHFPTDDQITDYVRYRNYFPRMKAATMCMWLETDDFTNDVTAVASYATSSLDNALLFTLGSPTHRIFVGPAYRFTSRTILPFPLKNHVCVWFNSASQQVGLVVNNEIPEIRSSSGNTVEGGGTLVLGQDQDVTNAGRLDADQAFRGNITNFMIWPRVLSRLEIDAIAYECHCPNDYAIVMSPDRVELYGDVSYSVPDVCPTL